MTQNTHTTSGIWNLYPYILNYKRDSNKENIDVLDDKFRSLT